MIFGRFGSGGVLVSAGALQYNTPRSAGTHIPLPLGVRESRVAPRDESGGGLAGNAVRQDCLGIYQEDKFV